MRAPREDGVADLFAPPGEAAEIGADYATTGLTLRRHPLALLRADMRR